MILVARAWPLTAALLCLAGCAPATFPVPEQRPAAAEPEPLVPFVEMGAYSAAAHIVRDVAGSPEGAGWRWTYRDPELRFRPGTARKFAMDYGIVPEVFKITGPVTLSVKVNGHPLGEVRCESPGERHFERAVPAGWLTPETHVVARVDRHYTGADGSELGYILHRAGFVP
ncbi:MAG: hypothetical protein M1541_13925 [Acidobacteria bacterium]|nr:hypothetical protein [Acidobacteriota bacterium]